MKIQHAVFAVSALALSVCMETYGGASDKSRITGLKVDQLVSPANIGAQPSFSWMMESMRRGASQKAYRIRVVGADGRESWDSGPVENDVSVAIAYAGEPLECASRYLWSVSVKDECGEWTESEPGFFETGLWGADAWKGAEWISCASSMVRPGPRGVHDPDAKLVPEDGTDCFVRSVRNSKELASAWWTVTGLGVFEAYVNGSPVAREMPDGSEHRDFLKPGCTHNGKTKHSFTYDVTRFVKKGAGEANVFSAQVSSGWWRDKIANFTGGKSAFRARLILRYADGTRETVGTDESWLSCVAGPVLRAGIFDGEDYDARVAVPWMKPLPSEELIRWGFRPSEINREFNGETIPMEGPGVQLRHDLALPPVRAYVYNGVEGAASNAYGRVVKVREYRDGEVMVLEAGETLVLDFAQNAAAVPQFVFAAKSGTALNVRTAEMLNDGGGLKSRGNDGPEGSAYLENYRTARSSVNYVFSGEGDECYVPSFTFFGYRYLSLAATGRVTVKRVRSVPVTSVARGSESGCIETDNPPLNRLFKNALWGQYSNYLSIPTDCPQRNERLGWTADTQVFAQTAAYNANVYGFLYKWMRDVRDTQHDDGSYTAVAPKSQYGDDGHRLGWADAGIIVPYVIWKHYGDSRVIDANWRSMERFMALLDDMKYASDKSRYYQWADWLAYECVSLDPDHDRPEPDGHPHIWRNKITEWGFLGGCYWLRDAEMMAEMAVASGRAGDAEKYRKMAARAREHLKTRFLDPADGQLTAVLRPMQTPALFALRAGILSPAAAEATRSRLLENIRAHGDCLQTGFLGTSILLDTLVSVQAADTAYTLLLQRKNPSWLYSVEQGATTIWERWNSYTKKDGFGAAGMNSFNHYAYGCVAGWMYSTMAGIRSVSGSPGFKKFVLSPVVDRRVGRVSASFRSPYGEIKSAWEWKDGRWIWDFTVPANSSAVVSLPGERDREYTAGTYRITK